MGGQNDIRGRLAGLLIELELGQVKVICIKGEMRRKGRGEHTIEERHSIERRLCRCSSGATCVTPGTNIHPGL